jgi:nicotinamide-nucleotide amidase
MTANIQLIEAVARHLTARAVTLVTAESCTGGLIAAEMTAVPGSSAWFEGAFVTYRLSAKQRMIGVRRETLEQHGAVSEPTAREMAEGALAASDAGISLAVTGIAGPDGGDVLTPVGTVWFAWAVAAPEPRCIQASRHELAGGREAVRQQAVRVALEGVLRVLEELPSEELPSEESPSEESPSGEGSYRG